MLIVTVWNFLFLLPVWVFSLFNNDIEWSDIFCRFCWISKSDDIRPYRPIKGYIYIYHAVTKNIILAACQAIIRSFLIFYMPWLYWLWISSNERPNKVCYTTDVPGHTQHCLYLRQQGCSAVSRGVALLQHLKYSKIITIWVWYFRISMLVSFRDIINSSYFLPWMEINETWAKFSWYWHSLS